jgi:ArsR family transcriptional regulator
MSATALEVKTLSQLCKAMGDETRLRIVALLAHGELCVCHLEQALELSQPNVSKHLGILRNAGVVGSRRQASWIYYRLADQPDDDRRRLLKTVVATFRDRAVLRRDVEKLLKVRGPNSCL